MGTNDGYVYVYAIPDDLLSVKNITDASPNFSINPNPAQDILLLVSSEAADYRIIDVCGRELGRGTCLQGETAIDIDALTSGSYVLQLRMGSEWMTKVFVVWR